MTGLPAEAFDILLRLGVAAALGAAIGFERRVHHKAIGIAGMMLIAIGSTTYMLLGRHLAETDPSSLSRTLQGFLSGIGFLGGAVIFKSGFVNVRV
jgi:putative Mg2+ transporter-C (MgtC) family protein